MSDIRDFTGKNRKFKGTKGIVLPKGTQAERADTESGEIRYNTDTNLAEYYTGTEWKPIDSPPALTSVSPTNPVDDGSTVTEITLSGSNIQSGGTLTIIGNDATEYSVSSFTRVNSTTITFNYTTALAAAGVNTPYSIKYANPSGLSAQLDGTFIPNVAPIFNTASGSLGSIDVGNNASTFTQISVTDTSGGTLVYSISDGALPDGATINSSTGAISGTTTQTGTFNFTIRVTDGTNVVERQFSASVTSPWIDATGGSVTTSGDYKIHTFTSSGCFAVSNAGTPSGSDTVDYLVVAGGGQGFGGGGGGGGYRESHSTPVSGCYSASPLATPTGITLTNTTYPITVGGSASPSVFSTITSSGGGPSNTPGGSGGGATRDGPGTQGSGNSPPVAPPQGNPGGDTGSNWNGGGGGGGAGGTGNNGGGGTPGNERAGPGGPGSTSSITGSPVTRAGGGGGRTEGNSTWASGGPGGGGNGGSPGSPAGLTGGSGGTNSGGGAGGGTGASGGSGIVVIRYKYQ